MKHSDIFDDQDRAFGLLHLLVEDYRLLPMAERVCDRFEGEPIPSLNPAFLREHLWEFEVSEQELFSYALFLDTNLKPKFLNILKTIQSQI